MTAHIREFGSVSETYDGKLVFQNFWIEGDHGYLDTSEAIMSLVIKRLQKELRMYKKRRITVDMGANQK